MQIPVISDNVLTNLENNLEHEFSSATESNAEECAKKGIFEMEVLLGIDGEGSYRREVTKRWQESKYFSDHMTRGEAIVIWILSLLMFAAIPLSVIFIITNKSSLMPVMFLVFVTLFIMLLLTKKIIIKRQKSGAEEAIAKMEPHELFDFSSGSSRCHFYPNPALMGICKELSIDPEDVKPDLGKVSGGGSTYVGWGSGTAVGTGVTLTTISSMRAASKNSSINYRIEKLENYLFYNNIAQYFNSKVAPRL